MQSIIKPYTRFLIKQHWLYFVALLILWGITLTIPRLGIAKLSANRDTAAQLRSEVEKLQTKRSLLDDIVATERGNVNRDIILLNTLVPDVEDYFSIIVTLEELSRKTGFIISSYNINSSDPLDEERLTLEISGVGDNEAFLNFLESYKFEGGRLITLDKIELKPKTDSRTFSLRLNFYHKGVDLTKDSTIKYAETLKIVRELREKVNITLKEPDLSQTYPTKKNPF